MGIRESFLFRLFNSVQEAEGQGQSAEKVIGDVVERVAEAERREAEQLMKEEVSPPLPGRKELELPWDHALIRLYDLWTDQTGEHPALSLYLEGISPDKEDKELKRLEKELEQEAKKRLLEALPRKPETSGEPEKSGVEYELDVMAALEALDGNIDQETLWNQESPKEQEAAKPEDTQEPALDALPYVFISADKMEAWLLIFPPVGQGKEADKEMLEEALAGKGITFGIEEELIAGIIDASEKYFHIFMAAKGEAAIQGKDGYIVDLYPRVIERKFEVDEHDRVDYASLNLIQNADKGDVICEAVPPTMGVTGRTVLGQKLSAKDGKAVKLPKGRNTEISEDGTKLLALQAGHVEFNNGSFQVKTVMEIDSNVDYTTGNINFLGDVHIRGDVCSGFTVRAVGDITVDGVVESGNVEAGGDLIVVKGIVGDRSSVVKAHRDIYAKYLESSIVHAKGNLHTDCILHSDVYCDGEIKVCTGKGVVIGGKLRAARGMEAKIVGSKSGSPTAVKLGGQPCAEFEKKLLIKEKEDLEKEMAKLEKQPESPSKTKRMNKIRLDLSVNGMKMGRFEQDMERIKAALEKQGGVRLRCQIAYPGIVLSIGDEKAQLTRETSSCNARLVEGEIKWS
ncbi:MAG: FapA family protein [Lachnospiraceae bacterium]